MAVYFSSAFKVSHRVFAALSLPVVATACAGTLACSFLYLKYRQSADLKAAELARQTFASLKGKILAGTPLIEADRNSPAFLTLQALKPVSWPSPAHMALDRMSPIILNVLFGVKPAFEFVLESSREDDHRLALATLKKACALNPSCHLIDNGKKETGHHYILINASPIPLFDPAKYLKGYTNYQDSLPILREYRLGDRVWQQQMAYVVGFGPSWEAFCGHCSAPFVRTDGVSIEQAAQPPDRTEEDVFSDEHYRQLGLATDPHAPQDAVQRGRDYSQTFRDTLKQRDVSQPKARDWDTDLCKRMEELNMDFFADETVIKTSYFKYSVLYASRIRQAFGYKVNQGWVAAITAG